MKQKSSEQRSLQRRIANVTMPITRKRIRWGRNWPCLCGSEKKYKRCCLKEIDAITISDSNANVAKLPEDMQKFINAHQKAQKNGGMKKNG